MVLKSKKSSSPTCSTTWSFCNSELVVFLTSVDSENGVKWAKANYTCQNKYC